MSSNRPHRRSATVDSRPLRRRLADAIQIRLYELDDIDHIRTTVAQLAQALSAIGQVTSDQAPGAAADAAVVMMPPGLVNRAARYLAAAATLVNEGVLPEHFSATHASQLAARFLKDAASLRYYADELPGQRPQHTRAALTWRGLPAASVASLLAPRGPAQISESSVVAYRVHHLVLDNVCTQVAFDT